MSSFLIFYIIFLLLHSTVFRNPLWQIFRTTNRTISFLHCNFFSSQSRINVLTRNSHSLSRSRRSQLGIVDAGPDVHARPELRGFPGPSGGAREDLPTSDSGALWGAVGQASSPALRQFHHQKHVFARRGTLPQGNF